MQEANPYCKDLVFWYNSWMIDPLSHGFDPALFWYLFPKIGLSLCLGTLIGFVREKQGKPAGIKTYALITVGVTLFTACSILAGSGQVHGVDPTRIVAQVVSGIGFLGAGMIFKDQDRVTGLTSAAYVWFVAALGILIGLGGYLAGLVIGVGMVIFTSLSARFEKWKFSEKVHGDSDAG